MYQVTVSVFCLTTVTLSGPSSSMYVCVPVKLQETRVFWTGQRQQMWKSVGYTAGWSPLAISASIQPACKPTCI